MLAYYSIITVLCLMSLGCLSVLVWENDRMSEDDKRLFYLAYVAISMATVVEWVGGWCDGRPGMPPWALPTVKCVDFIMKPMAGGALVAQLRLQNRWVTALEVILSVNVVVQIVAALNGWMVVVDSHGHYDHGVLYPAYLTACIAVVVLVSVEFMLYGRAFRRQNSLSLIAVMSFVLLGIAMQALLPMRPKAVCVAMAMGASLMYIRFAEFSSLELDDRLAAQRKKIATDALTGVLSRHAYTQAIADLNALDSLPDDTVVFVVDINGLKHVNDSLGHDAGDELIIGAADCLRRTFSAEGRIFRTGGDEFVVIASMGHDEAETMLGRLSEQAAAWHGALVDELSLSSGSASVADSESTTMEALVHEADLVMYDAKAAYYRSAGRDRRRRRD